MSIGEQKLWSVQFTVTGRGPFPNDMLRHDCCFPADTTSAWHMADCAGTREFVEIHLRAMTRALSAEDARRRITAARWASFGWGAEIRNVEQI
jgi:hypothetical protein